MAPKKNPQYNKKQNKEQTPDTESDTTIDSDTKTTNDSSNNSENKKYTFVEEKKYLDTNIYPHCFELKKNKGDKSIFQSNNNVIFSENMEFPSFEYGFHHFVHQSKNYLNDETKKFEGRKKVWNVLNRYETSIDNHTQSISDISKKYFSEFSKIDIMSNAFYKSWELYTYFEMIDTKKENFTSAHLFDGLGNFSQSTILFRDVFCKKSLSKNDKCNLFDNEKIKNVDDTEIDKKFEDFYEKEKRIIKNKTLNLKQKCDFVTADGGFTELNENLQEKESPKLLIYEIISAIKLLKKGGVFVCKFFETFTKTSLKIITILTELFENIYFIKPLMSKSSSNEKYAVCLNFAHGENDKEYKNILESLEKIYEKMNKMNDKENIVNIFSEYNVPQNISIMATNMNISLSNSNFKQIGRIIKFIRNQVYSGEEYHENRDEQIEGTKYWTSLYFDDNIDKIKDKTKSIIKLSIEDSAKNMNAINKNKESIN
jgi:hypothetical protein